MKSPTPPTKDSDSYHHGDLRQALIETAFASIDADGYDGLSLSSLAKSLGVSQAAPYRHFPDRNALLTAVAVRGFREFIAMLEEAKVGRKDRTLARMGHAYVEFGTRRPGIYRLMFASPVLPQAPVDDELRVVARQSFELLVGALDNGARPRDCRRRALHIWVALHGAVMLANQDLLEGEMLTIEMPELVKAIVSI